MKRSIVVLAAAVSALSTGALAESEPGKMAQEATAAVKLSDSELDAITAGARAFSEIVIFNPGQANVLKMNGGHITCINCVPVDMSKATWGMMNVLLPTGGVVSVPIGQSPYQ